MNDAEAIKAWLDRWDEHKNDNCYCEKCRRKRAILTAIEALDNIQDQHPAEPEHMVLYASIALSRIRETLVSE